MIDNFHGPYRFLSNFYPIRIGFKGDVYPSVEHAYQAAKTLDSHSRLVIRRSTTAGQAKVRGGWVKLRPDWYEIRLQVMETLVRYKFTYDLGLMNRLRATGDEELIEGNIWGDRFWGVYEGEGENHLGKILMKIRTEIGRDT